jgi:hypothetical protein
LLKTTPVNGSTILWDTRETHIATTSVMWTCTKHIVLIELLWRTTKSILSSVTYRFRVGLPTGELITHNWQVTSGTFRLQIPWWLRIINTERLHRRLRGVIRSHNLLLIKVSFYHERLFQQRPANYFLNTSAPRVYVATVENFAILLNSYHRKIREI